MKHSDQQIIELFKEAVKEVDSKPIPPVTGATEIARLGLDSVATMEVIGVMEEKLNLRFPDEDLATIKTIADLTALIHRLS